MPVFLRLAFRNLKQHRAKTLIVGILVAAGMAVLVSGSSIINLASSGIEKTFIDNFTGNVVITGVTDAEVSLFGVHANMMSETVPTLPRYRDIVNYVTRVPGFVAATGQITGYAIINGDEENKLFAMLFGIQADQYRSMFNSISIVEGSQLSTDQEGILLEHGMITELREKTGNGYNVGDPVLLSGFGAAGFRIREVPIRGVFAFKQKTELLERLAFIDSQSLRSLLGMTVGTVGEITIGENEVSLLEMDTLDSMFSGDIVDAEADAAEHSLPEVLPPQPEKREISDTNAPESLDHAWHFLLIQTASTAEAYPLINELNDWFASEDIAARAIDWKRASAGFGVSADILKGVFIVGILIVSAVAVIIMMNTLTVSVFERTSEIGTMRALGAQKNFVWKMLFTETLTVTVVFGLVGIAIGLVIIAGIRGLRIEASDMITNTLFGGPVLLPFVRIRSLLFSLLLTAVIGVVSCLYPIYIAMNIPPVQAINVE